MDNKLEKWYREKFNLRIEKNKLLKVGAKYWKDFTLEEKEAIQKYVNDTSELHFGFFNHASQWTLVGVRNIYSFYNGIFTVADFECINGDMSLVYDESLTQKEIKTSVCFLKLNRENKVIWVPEGRAILGLMNTLLYVTKKYTNRPV